MKKPFLNFIDFHIFLFHLFLLLFFLKKTKENQNCPKENPFYFYSNNECKPDNCFQNPNECFINNSIINTQWLNNIINIEIQNMRYVHFASYSNGDMILQGTTFPASDIRAFLGFKKNGRSFFKDKVSNKDSYFYSINATNQTIKGKYESTNIVIKLSGIEKNQKEYLMSVSKEMSYTEIYDFENGKIYQKLLYDFSKMKYINSYQNVAIPLNSYNNNYYYLFGFIGNTSEFKDNKFVLQKHKFQSIENFEIEETLESFEKSYSIAIDTKDTGFSCFQTENHYILCFFLTNNKYYIITAYDINFNWKTYSKLNKIDIYFNQIFHKCIHLKEEIGIFIYYVKNSQNIYFPTLLFRKCQDNPLQIINYSIDNITINSLNIQFDPYLLLNDLIKINNNKICFCSFNNEVKNKLYIVLLNLYQYNSYQIRYYLVNLENLYGFKIGLYMKAHKYNNFISIAFDFYSNYNEKCNTNKCISLLIFSYPNSTDNELVIDEYLYKNLTLEYININLEKEVRIENNIFGYVFCGIEIKELLNCENLNIKTNLFNDNIYLNYTLKRNEIIKIEFSGINYNSFVCNLQYNYIITEPDVNKYNEYFIDFQGNKDRSHQFDKEKYIGRLTYYNITLNEDLITDCLDINCGLCFKNNNNFCINCKYNFTKFPNGTKVCLENPEKVTEIYSTTLMDSKNSDEISYDKFTNGEKLTDIITIYKTSIRESDTDIITYKNNSIEDNLNTDIITYKNNSVEDTINTDIITYKNNSVEDTINTDIITYKNNSVENNKNIDNIQNTNKAEYSEKIIIQNNIEIIKREIKENKEQLNEILPDIIESIEIGKNYEMDGEDFTITIKPTNTSIPSKTHVDFSSCEKILREVNHIDDSRIITFFQLEINDKNSQSLVNQVGYQAYDDNKKILDLSVCNDTSIQVFYLIKSNSSLDKSFISSFRDSNYDILNIKDDFFNDICTSYADSGNDVILEDRINDIYQNYSFCDDGCTYNESNLELMMITCDCKVKQNLTTNLSDANLVQKDDLKKSSAFEIIKCYKLVFSLKNKFQNVGFLFLTGLFLLQIPFLIIYFYKGIKPVEDYIKKEMKENGYIKDNENINNIENDKEKKKKKEKEKGK